MEVDPNHAEANYRLAVLMEAQNNAEQALKYFEAALRQRQDWASPLRRIAWIRATSGDAKLRNAEQAVALASKAAELTSRTNPVVLDTLAAAYAAASRFDEAVATAEEAMKMAAQKLPPAFIEQMRGRLQLYQQRRPFVTPGETEEKGFTGAK